MQEMLDRLDVLAECSSCGERFSVLQNAHFRKECKSNDGKSILLTYYDCPNCKKRHFVQVDNAVSISILTNVIKDMSRITSVKRSGRDVPVKMQDRYTRHNRHLDAYRKRLMYDWNGKCVTEVETGAEHVLQFVV